jgi:hypothetical protein
MTSAQGEPLLSPHFGECLKLAIDAGFNVRLNTNCTPLSEKNIDAICTAASSGRLHVYPSFSGYDKTSHEEVYVGSRFEDSARKLETLNQRLAARRLDRALTVNGIIMDPASRDRHLAFLEGLGIQRSQVVLGLPDNFAGIVQVGSKHGLKGLYSFKQDLPHRSLRLCNLLAHYLVVYDDGKVSACGCRDSEGIMEIGDITRESLFEIRNAPRFKQMIAAFMARNLDELPLCQSCDVPYGDHSNPVVYSGPSVLGPDAATIQIIDNGQAGSAEVGSQDSALRPGRPRRLNYTSYGRLVSVISLPPEQADASQGVALLGNDFQPSHARAKLCIRLVLNGWTEADNSLVIAFYRDGGNAPSGLVSKPLQGGRTTIVDLSFVVHANTVGIVPIKFRVGPGRPGTIFINGDASGPEPVQPVPYLEIREEDPGD